MYIGEDAGGLTGNATLFRALSASWLIHQRKQLDSNFAFMWGFINILVRRRCFERKVLFPSIPLAVHAERMLSHDIECVLERGAQNLSDQVRAMLFRKVDLCENLDLCPEKRNQLRELLLVRWGVY